MVKDIIVKHIEPYSTHPGKTSPRYMEMHLEIDSNQNLSDFVGSIKDKECSFSSLVYSEMIKNIKSQK